MLAVPGSDSDFDEEDGGYEDEDLSEEDGGISLSRSQPGSKIRDDSESEAEGGEEEEDKGWGASKRDYYDADQIETEADALEEEQEALRLQKRQLQDMREADYGFDENEWLDAGKLDEEDEDRDAVVQEVLPELEITEDMTTQERSKIMEARYPEFKPLAAEFLSLQARHEDLVLAEAAANAVLRNKKQSSETAQIHVASVKRSALGGYLAALSMYFAVLSSGSKSRNGEVIAKAPAEFREHPVMETLMQSRTLWEKVKDVPVPEPGELIREDVVEDNINGVSTTNGMDRDIEEKPKKKRRTKAERAAAKARYEAEARRAEKERRLEQRLASIEDRMKITPSMSIATAPVPQPNGNVSDNSSDFGEETVLTAEEAAEKARRKKGLRFYTSQIVQKANKREGAGRDAGGDADIPYRERLKDRTARLNAEAEARGKKKQQGKEALGGDSDSEADARVSREVRNDGDEGYYDFVASKAKAKKDAKTARAAAHREAAAQGAMVREVEEVGADGKRKISYAIEKNKGLTPKRNKDVRNPRVKKRKKYEQKKKKLSSIRPVYKGGEAKSGYAGERTGIKTGLIKSTKL